MTGSAFSLQKTEGYEQSQEIGGMSFGPESFYAESRFQITGKGRVEYEKNGDV